VHTMVELGGRRSQTLSVASHHIQPFSDEIFTHTSAMIIAVFVCVFSGLIHELFRIYVFRFFVVGVRG
jgi:hypothetical protein